MSTHLAPSRAQVMARRREEAAKKLADAVDAEAHLGATSTSAELGSGIERLEGAIEIAVAAGVDVSAARARVEQMRAAKKLAEAVDAEAHLGATSTSAELESGIKRLEGAIAMAEDAGVDVSAARERLKKLQAATEAQRLAEEAAEAKRAAAAKAKAEEQARIKSGHYNTVRVAARATARRRAGSTSLSLSRRRRTEWRSSI